MRAVGLKMLAGLALAVGAGAFLTNIATWDYTAVTASGDEIAVDVSAIRPGSARLFCYTDDAGKRLRFVLARGTDGKMRSVFDACRECAAFHRGYRLASGELICRECGNRYPVDRMTEGKASCVPVGLPHRDDSAVVRIKTADLKAGRELF